MKPMDYNDGYSELANAIIIQDVRDYERALTHWKNGDRTYKVESDIFMIEKFFRSDKFVLYSRDCIDGEELIRLKRKEILNEQ